MKITPELAAKIRGACAAGIRQKIIARHAKVSLWTVANIAKGACWGKVDGDRSIESLIAEWLGTPKQGMTNGEKSG